jgi:hypothetical protein
MAFASIILAMSLHIQSKWAFFLTVLIARTF